MASGTFYPATGTDDGLRYSVTSFNTTWTSTYIGRSTYSYKPFVRFPNVGIPADVVITSAFLRFKSFQSANTTTCNLKLQFNDVDDAVAPTSYSEYDALVKTTAVVNWNNVGAWAPNVSYDSIDISSLIQEIVNRVGWLSGNAMMFLGDDNGSDDNTYKRFYTYENGSGYVELHVTWELPPPEVIFTFTNPTPVHLSTVYGTTKQLHLIATMSGVEESYVYNAAFYDGFDAQIGTTVSGIQSGQPAESNEYLSTPSGIDYSWYMTASSSGVEDTSSTYTFHNRFLASGTTEVNGALTSGIDVRLYKRDTGELIGSSTSTVSGIFDIETQYNSESYCVALSPYTDTNSLIYDFLEPGD